MAIPIHTYECTCDLCESVDRWDGEGAERLTETGIDDAIGFAIDGLYGVPVPSTILIDGYIKDLKTEPPEDCTWAAKKVVQVKIDTKSWVTENAPEWLEEIIWKKD